MNHEMNQVQLMAFWVWFQSGQATEQHNRSFTYTAERLNLSVKTVCNWHDQFGWAALAAEKDHELGRTLEREVIGEIVRTFAKAIERQQELVETLFKQFKQAIAEGTLALKVSDLLALMEFETNYIYGEQRGLPQGNLLGIVLGAMKPEQRTEFNATVERVRDAGQLQLAGMESARRN